MNKMEAIDYLISKIYGSQRNASRMRGHDMPKYTNHDLHLWFMNHPKSDKMVDDWLASDKEKKLVPSIHRMNERKGYEFDNIELLTWGDHQKLTAMTSKIHPSYLDHKNRKKEQNRKNNPNKGILTKVKLKPNQDMQDCLAELVQGRTIIHIECEASPTDIYNFNLKKAKNLKVYKRPVLCISNNKRYNSIQEAAKDLGLQTGAISKCANSKQQTTKGMKFEYLNKKETK